MSTENNNTNKYVHPPNILKPTLVEFTNELYLKNALGNKNDKKQKVTVIEIPKEWLNAYFNKYAIDEKCREIKIKSIITQKFSKIEEEEAFLFESEIFFESSNESNSESKEEEEEQESNYYSIEKYNDAAKNYGMKTDSSLTMDENYLKFLHEKNSTALYAPDNDYSFFEDFHGDKQWNLNKFVSLIHRIKNTDGEKVPGIHTPYTYFGSAGSTFPCHLEDGNFLSINIHYRGADKIWFIVHQQDGTRFQKIVNEILDKCFPESGCSNLMGHKLFIMTEQFLQAHKITYTKVIQKPGTIVITHPFSFHGGYNTGFNINEAINFANIDSVKYFANRQTCECSDIVHLTGDTVIRAKYPAYKNTIRGNPDDPIVIKKKKENRDANLAIGRAKSLAKRTENLELPFETIKHWLAFFLNDDTNPQPQQIFVKDIHIKKFKEYCKEKNYNLLPSHAHLSVGAWRTRIRRQINEPILEKKKTFNLCDKDLRKFGEKFNKSNKKLSK